MANFSALKTAIQNAIRQNGNEEITGDVLQQILLSVVNTMGDGAINTIEQNLSNETLARQNGDNTLQSNINSEAQVRGNADMQLQNAINAINTYLAKGYVFAGVATPTGTPVSGRVFYVATTAGRYTSFGNLQVQNGISILLVENDSWTLYQLLVVDLSLVQDSNNPVCGGAVYQEIQHEKTERQASDVQLQNNINNEKNRAVGAENGLHQEIIAETDARIEGLEEERDVRRQEIQGMRDDVFSLIHDYKPMVIEGNVVNAPDEEDITQQPNNLLKFKNKAYNPTIFSGLGRKYLRKNVVINEDYVTFDGFLENPECEELLEGIPDAVLWARLPERFVAEKDGVYYLDWQGSGDYIPVSADKIYVNENIPYFWNGEDLAVDDDVIARYGNILTQEMMSDANTIYVIQYDYDLNGAEITVPANCILEFDGGSLSNGVLIGRDTIIKGNFQNSINVLSGSFKNTAGEYLGWKGQFIDEFRLSMNFGDLLSSASNYNGERTIQSIVVTNSLVYLFYNRTIDSADWTVCNLYDRNYNYLGSSLLNCGACHANDATYDGEYIYIATCIDGINNLKKISAATLEENCRNNTNSTCTEISTASSPISIDYDAVNEEFCMYCFNSIVYVLDKNMSIIRQQAINIMGTVENNIGRTITLQGTVYKKGLLYVIAGDFYINSTPDDYGYTGGIVAVFDIYNNCNLLTTSHFLGFGNTYEVEGSCQDYDNNSIYTLGVTWGTENPCIYISNLYSENINVSPLDQTGKLIKNTIASATSTHNVYINNSFTGKSTGTVTSPYKSIGQAFAMASLTANSVMFLFKYTGQNYFCKYLSINNYKVSFVKYGNDVQKPIIECTFRLRDAQVFLNNIIINPTSNNEKFNNNSAIMAMHNSFIDINNCEMNLTAAAGVNVGMYLIYGSKVVTHNTNIYDSGQTTGTRAFAFVFYNAEGFLQEIESNNILLAANEDFSNNVYIDYNTITLNSGRFLGYFGSTNARYKQLPQFDLGTVTKVEDVTKLETLFAVSNDYLCKVNVFIENGFGTGAPCPRGLYTNAHGGKLSPYDIRLAGVGVLVGTTAQRPSTALSGFQYFDTTLGKPIYWTGTAWVDATGTPV